MLSLLGIVEWGRRSPCLPVASQRLRLRPLRPSAGSTYLRRRHLGSEHSASRPEAAFPFCGAVNRDTSNTLVRVHFFKFGGLLITQVDSRTELRRLRSLAFPAQIGTASGAGTRPGTSSPCPDCSRKGIACWSDPGCPSSTVQTNSRDPVVKKVVTIQPGACNTPHPAEWYKQDDDKHLPIIYL